LYRFDAPSPLQRIITTPEALSELASRLAGQAALSLDTEFLRERTYRAQLCLLQVGAASELVCVDPLAVPGLAPLGPVLANARISKVIHASRQDLEVLLPRAGPIHGVFDTQIAAGLAGLPPQIGYAELVRRLLGHDLAKMHTRTDWSRRPLSAEQIDYALDDVRYLLPLEQQLREQLDKLGRTAWLTEELSALADESRYQVEPAQAWLKIKGLGGLDPARTRLAQDLAAWRERRAIDRNRPRGWILDDLVLREIVLQVPRTPAALSLVKEIPPGVVKHCGEQILEVVLAAAVPDPAPPLPARSRPDPAKVNLVKRLATLTQEAAAELQLSAEVLATRRDLEKLADGRNDSAVLKGWRRGAVGERLLAALAAAS
jgi:ribonuclease D